MSPDRLITAPANQVSGREFFHAVFRTSPERRAERAEEGRQLAAEADARQRRIILDMRENIAALLSPDNARKAREEWALQDRVAEELSFTMDDQQRKRAVA